MKPIAPTETLRAALGLLGRHWAPLAQALVIPATCMAVLDVFWTRIVELGGIAETLGVVTSFLLLVVFAVSCHRILLLEQAGLPNRWGIYFTARESRFIGWSILIGLMQVPLALVSVVSFAVILSATLPGSAGETGWPHWAVSRFALLAPTFYITARFGLVLPATALDQRPTMAQAWRASSSNGWRLAIALALPAVSLWGIGWLLTAAIGDEPNLAWSLFFAVGLTLLGSIEVAVLSVSFRVLGPLPPAPAPAEENEFPPASELACLTTEGPWDAQEIAKALSAEGIPSRVDSYPPAIRTSEPGSSYRGHTGFATIFGVYVRHSDSEQAATTLDTYRQSRTSNRNAEPHIEDFCPGCGSPIRVGASECLSCQLAFPLHCGECGAQIEESDPICAHCGADPRSAAV